MVYGGSRPLPRSSQTDFIGGHEERTTKGLRSWLRRTRPRSGRVRLRSGHGLSAGNMVVAAADVPRGRRSPGKRRPRCQSGRIVVGVYARRRAAGTAHGRAGCGPWPGNAAIRCGLTPHCHSAQGDEPGGDSRLHRLLLSMVRCQARRPVRVMDFPKPLPLLERWDRHAVDRWLDRLGGEAPRTVDDEHDAWLRAANG